MVRPVQLTDLGHVCNGEVRYLGEIDNSPDEAVRDLTRAREVAMLDLKKKRQQLLSFLLRHGRIFPGAKNWTKMHERWLAAGGDRRGDNFDES